MPVSRLDSIVFKKSFYTYFAVLFIILTCFSAVYFSSYYKQRISRIEQTYVNDAERISTALDASMAEFIEMKENIRHSTWVKKLMTPSYTFLPEFDALSKIERQEELVRYLALNDAAGELAVLLPQKSLVVSPYGWFTTKEFETFFKGKIGIDYSKIEELAKQHTDINSIAFKINEKYDKPLVCLQSLDNLGQPAATLLLLVDREKFENHVTLLSGENTQRITLVSRSGIKLFDTKNSEEEKSAYKVEIPSGYIDASYKIYSRSPKEIIFADIAFIQAVIMGMGLFFAAVILSYLLSVASYRPLERLTAYIVQTNGAKANSCKGEYEFIENSFEEVYGKNVSMHAKMELYYTAARNNMLMKLLKGYFQSFDIEETLAEYNIAYSQKQSYMVWLLSCISNEIELDVATKNKNAVSLITRAGQLLSEYRINFEIVEAMDSDTVIILSFPNPKIQESDLLDAAYQLKSAIFKNEGLMLNVSIGQLYQGIIGISKSYHGLKDSISTDNDNYSFDVFQNSKENENYYYPTDWEIQLISSMKAGNISTAKKIFEEIVTENICRELDAQMNFRLVSLLLETIKRIAYEMKLDITIFDRNIQKLLHYQQDSDKVWSAFSELVLCLCDETVQSFARSASSEGGEIIQYVIKNHSEVTMSLKELSERFGIPTYAVSKIFKENSGVNFYEYITNLRMKQAKKMLEEEEYDIIKISRSVGYENEYSFRRAFLKATGIKPREYANEHNKRTLK